PQPGQTVAPSKIPPKPASSPEQVAWTYDPGAVTLSLWADPRLNEYQGDSHALMLCVLQLKNAQSYQELSRTAAGLTRMLACKRFDEHVAGAKKVFVQPGRNATHVMDRLEGAKYVALVAGYYDLSPGPAASRLFEVPLHVSDSGILFTTLEYAPAPLIVEILLGPHEMQMIGSQ
ncbi:MAG: type VI secretion lipoprotein TssJ, partial [Desulfovibrionaceae bacterium]